MARTTAGSRMLVEPQGGWWTGAGSMWFDGIDDRVTGANPLAGTGPFSLIITCSPKNHPDSAFHAFMCAGSLTAAGFTHGVYSGITNGNLFSCGTFGSGKTMGTSQQRPLPRAWYRVGVAFDGGVAQPIRIYVNGVGSSAAAVNLSPDITGASVFIGIGAVGVWPFGGWLHDARIYSVSLPASAFVSDASGEWISDTGLVRHWPLESIVGGKTYERIGGTWDTVTGAIIDTANKPFASRTAAGTRTTAEARTAV